MDQNIHQPVEQLIEELRSSGYHGREPRLASLPPRLGTRLAAIRQLEVAAEQAASLWLDGGMSSHDTWEFIRLSFLPRMLALVEIIERTFPAADCPPSIRRLIEQFASDEMNATDCSPAVVSILVAVMVLRQLHEFPDSSGRTFVPFSSNVHSEFFARCVGTLGWPPFDASERLLLVELSRRIDACQHVFQARPTSSKSLAS
jgi:hypothetical protein